MVQKSALLTKYLDLYKKKPTSRVFAPLAETYRKLGMYDEALSILKSGIRYNSTYPLGYIILGHCYYDLEKYDHAYEVVRPFVKNNLDNISLQKLFAQICEKINRFDEALETYKYLLFVNPKDEVVAEKVEKLERDLYPTESQSQQNIINDQDAFDSEENWVQVSFVDEEEVETLDDDSAWSMEKSENFPEEVHLEESSEESVGEDIWEVQEIKPEDDKIQKFKQELQAEIDLDEPNLDDEYYLQDFDNEEEEVLETEIPEKPIITHTLVDLYLKQNHFEKAIEFLESILVNHPEDIPTQKKLLEVKQKLSESLGHDNLLELVEKTQSEQKERIQQVESKLNLFIHKIQLRAQEKRA